METRIAIVSIIISNEDSVSKVNEILHNFKDYVIGRMGLPHKEKNLNIISIVIDAPETASSALAGKLGMIDGVTSKTIYAPKQV